MLTTFIISIIMSIMMMIKIIIAITIIIIRGGTGAPARVSGLLL